MDYMFMGEETGAKTLTIFVAKDRSSRALMSTVVPRKTTGAFVSNHVVAFMKMSEVTLKTDNEPALVAMADDVAKVRASRGAQRNITGEQSGMFFQEWWSDRAGRPDDPGNGEDAQEEKLDGQARPQERAVDVVGGVCGMAGEACGGGPRLPDATRTAEGQEGTVAGSGVWGGRDVEEEISGRPAGQVVLPLERRHLLRREVQHG